MALEIGEHQVEGVTVLALKGRITLGEVTRVREKITQLLARDGTTSCWTWKHVDYIDSTGLGNLVISYTQVQKAAAR